MAPFTSEFGRLYRELRAKEKGPFHSSEYYEYAGDLREYSHDVRLNLYCRKQKTGNHKVEVLDVGTKSRSQILREVSAIFDVDPYTLGVMRVDLAVDVRAVPLSWFREAVRVSHKRWRAGMADSQSFNEMGNRDIQTLYYGKRPNLFRIYDKMAEYRSAYRALQRSFKGKPIPSFESIYGVPDDESILTRVERQIGGRVLAQLATLKDVIEGAANFNPFAAFKIASQVAVPLSDSTLPFETLCTANYLRDMASREGMQAIGPFFNQKTNGNSAWAWKKYGPYLACLSESNGLTSSELQGLFEKSIARQFAR